MAIAAPPELAWPKAADATTYAADVVDRRIVAGRLVRLACQRHLDDLERGHLRGLHFDEERAQHNLDFFRFLNLAEGPFAGKPFRPEPPQVFILASIFGWIDRAGFRRFLTAYVEEGKGNGKTPLAAGTGIYGMAADGEASAEVYTAGVTRDQGNYLLRDAKKMVDASPSLSARLEVGATNIAHPASGSFMRSVSSEGRSLDQKRVHMALLDEVHEHRDDTPWNKMSAGTKGRRQALIMGITNSGFDRNTVCWTLHKYSREVLEGIIADDAWFAYVCGLDVCDVHRAAGRLMPEDGCETGCDDWRNPLVWPKANPLLGVSITEQYLAKQVREAEGMPTKQGIVKRLNFCIWTEGVTRWLDVEAFDACSDARDAIAPTPLEKGRDVFGGLDLASTRDLNAFAELSARNDCPAAGHAGRCSDLRCLFWLPEDNMRARVERDRVPYDTWARQGWIRLTPGNVADYDRIRLDIREEGEHLRIRGIGHDRWNATQIVTQLKGDGFDMVPVGQGFASLSAPAKVIESDVAGRFIHHDGNPVLRWMVSNAVADQDAAGNIKPDREKSTEKIDGVAAWCDAVFARDAADPADGPSVYDGLAEEEILKRMLGE